MTKAKRCTLTPKRLETAALDKHFDSLLQSKMYKRIDFLCNLIGPHKYGSDYHPALEVKYQLETAVERVQKYVNGIFKQRKKRNCPNVKDCYNKRLLDRVYMKQWSPKEVFTMVCLGDTVVLHEDNYVLGIALSIVKLSVPNVKSLRSKYDIDPYILEGFLHNFPNLEKLEACFIFPMLLETIKNTQHKIQEITFGYEEKITDNELCQFFFCGTGMKWMKKNYTECVDVKVSFPCLRYLKVNFSTVERTTLLRYILHYYPKCEVYWAKSTQPPPQVSDFRCLLSYSMDLNPNHAMSKCMLTYTDFRFEYLEDVLINWKNLKTLELELSSIFGVETQVFQQKMDKILTKCSSLETLHLTILKKDANIPEIYKEIQSILDTFAICPNIHILHVRTFGAFKLINIVKFLNCFPNLTTLYMHLFWHKNKVEEKLPSEFKTMIHLRDLRISIDFPEHGSNTKEQYGMFIDKLLDATPNLHKISVRCELDTFMHIGKRKFKLFRKLEKVAFSLPSFDKEAYGMLVGMVGSSTRGKEIHIKVDDCFDIELDHVSSLFLEHLYDHFSNSNVNLLFHCEKPFLTCKLEEL